MSTTRPLATRRSRGRGAAVILTAVLAIAPAAVQAQAALKIPRTSLGRVLGVTAAQLHAARLATASGTQPIPQGASQVTLAPGAFLVAPLGSTTQSHVTPAGKHFDLPFQLYGVKAAGGGVRFRVRFDVAGGGLRYDPADGNFRGDLLVGLEDVSQPGATDRLAGAVRMQLTGPDTVSPEQLTLSHTNIPFQTVRLVAATHDDVVTVHIRPSFEPNGVDARIPVRRPLVLATLTPKRIDGYGLETATLTIVGSAGVPKESLAVSLSAERGALGATSLDVPRNRSVTTTLRSRGVGPDRLTITSVRSDPFVLTITYAFPVAFLIFALFGGLVGTLISLFQARGRQRAAVRARYMAAGVLSGLVAVVAWGLGVNLLGVPVTIPYGSEAAAFVIAYLGGHHGLTRLAAKAAPVGRWLGGGAAT